MTGELEERVRRFAVDVLERRGALVEWEEGSDEGMAVLPGELARRLEVADAVRVVGQAVASTAAGREVLSVSLAGDFLERVEPLVGVGVAQAHLRIGELYLKRSAMNEPVAQAFVWANARVRVGQAAGARVEYHVWHLRATLESEDRWEDVVAVAVNAQSGAMVQLPDPMGLSEAVPASTPAAAGDGTLEAAGRHGARLVQARTQGFVARLEARLGRDRKRVKDYYAALMRESRGGPRRGGGGGGRSAEPHAAEDKQRAVELELRRKTLELEERYTIRATLAPVALVSLDLPVLAVDCDVLRKQTRGTLRVYWNPLLRALEPVACGRCGRNIQTVYFTDDQAQPVCVSCYNA